LEERRPELLEQVAAAAAAARKRAEVGVGAVGALQACLRGGEGLLAGRVTGLEVEAVVGGWWCALVYGKVRRGQGRIT
jgi:hypothetical protein